MQIPVSKKDYVNFNEDWDPDNYIEISIADQKVYFLKKGKVKATFRCITPPCTGRAPPTGVFFIKEHKRAYTLTVQIMQLLLRTGSNHLTAPDSILQHGSHGQAGTHLFINKRFSWLYQPFTGRCSTDL